MEVTPDEEGTSLVPAFLAGFLETSILSAVNSTQFFSEILSEGMLTALQTSQTLGGLQCQQNSRESIGTSNSAVKSGASPQLVPKTTQHWLGGYSPMSLLSKVLRRVLSRMVPSSSARLNLSVHREAHEDPDTAIAMFGSLSEMLNGFRTRNWI